MARGPEQQVRSGCDAKDLPHMNVIMETAVSPVREAMTLVHFYYVIGGLQDQTSAKHGGAAHDGDNHALKERSRPSPILTVPSCSLLYLARCSLPRASAASRTNLLGSCRRQVETACIVAAHILHLLPSPLTANSQATNGACQPSDPDPVICAARRTRMLLPMTA